MWLRSLLACLLAAPAATAQDMNITCITTYCGAEFQAAIQDPNFLKNGQCSGICNNMLNESDPTYDASPEKLHYQNCTTTCAVTFESPAGDAMLACAMDHGCVSFPSIPTKCPYPEVDPESSLASLAGEWWQHRGKNALWDCYDCQHIHAMEIVNDTAFCNQTRSRHGGVVQAPCWSYTYSYDLYTVDDNFTANGTKYFGQTWQLPGDIPKGEAIDIYYNYMGSYHNETWYILKATDRYVLLVDCSYMMAWIDVGSIVWVRPNVTLTADENTAIAQVYKDKLGWDYTDFCHDTHGAENCDGPSAAGRAGGPRRAPPRQRALTGAAAAAIAAVRG